MLTPEQMHKFLSELAIAVPNKAPDFSRPEMVATWYRSLKEHVVTREHCRSIFRIATTKYDYFPSSRQMVEAARNGMTERDTEHLQGRRDAARLKYDQASVRCRTCDCSGQISAIDRTTGIGYGFRCIDCDAADQSNLSRMIPEWRSVFEARFEIPTFSGARIPKAADPTKALTMIQLAEECSRTPRQEDANHDAMPF